MIKKKYIYAGLLLTAAILLSACNKNTVETQTISLSDFMSDYKTPILTYKDNIPGAKQNRESIRDAIHKLASNSSVTETEDSTDVITRVLLEAGKHSGSPYVEINNNHPFFDISSITQDASFELYPDLDDLGRCGTAIAIVSPKTMPTEERGDIGMVKPSGWHNAKYDPDTIQSDSPYVYNRCHLIGYQLCGENANEKNLITGTRYLNVEGMLPFENKIAEYVKATGNSVYYKVTPVFEGDNLLASGVLMQAQSIGSDDLKFCVYCYNVQPNVTIDYATGYTEGPEFTGTDTSEQEKEMQKENSSESSDALSYSYIANNNSGKYHRKDCENAKKISEENKVLLSSKTDAEAQQFVAAKCCNP